MACVDLKVVARRLRDGRGVYQYMCESGAWASFSVICRKAQGPVTPELSCLNEKVGTICRHVKRRKLLSELTEKQIAGIRALL